MTSMDRVRAALTGTSADYPAFTMTLSLYGAKLTGCPLYEYYSRPEKYADGQTAVYDQFKPDIIFAPFALALEAQAFGSTIKSLDKSPPNVNKLLIRNHADTAKLMLPELADDPGLNYLCTSTRILRDHFTDAVPVCGVLTSPMDLPALIMGVENWLELLLFDKENAARIISIMAEYFVSMANRLFECGASFIAMAMVFSNPQILLEETLTGLIIPALSGIFSKVKGPIVFHHGSLQITRYLPHYLNLPNVAGFVLDHRDRFSEARVIAGNNTLLLGNLDGPTLGKTGTASAVEKTRSILDDRKNDRHFIFATSGADVAWDTPEETIKAIRNCIVASGNT